MLIHRSMVLRVQRKRVVAHISDPSSTCFLKIANDLKTTIREETFYASDSRKENWIKITASIQLGWHSMDSRTLLISFYLVNFPPFHVWFFFVSILFWLKINSISRIFKFHKFREKFKKLCRHSWFFDVTPPRSLSECFSEHQQVCLCSLIQKKLSLVRLEVHLNYGPVIFRNILKTGN